MLLALWPEKCLTVLQMPGVIIHEGAVKHSLTPQSCSISESVRVCSTCDGRKGGGEVQAPAEPQHSLQEEAWSCEGCTEMTDWALARGPPLPPPLALDHQPHLVVALQDSLESPLALLVPQTIDHRVEHGSDIGVD